MNSLLISDLHLTDDPRTEYRWKLFDWLVETMPKHEVRDLFILGDLTENKDRHSARLVNRIVDELLRCYRRGNLLGIWILRGNHDGTDPDCAYFKFLAAIPCIQYISHAFQKPFGRNGVEVLMLPHTNDPVKAWDAVEMHSADFVFMHATVRGALAENGMALDGIPPGLLTPARRARIFSGDIHVPQKVGAVEYVGAPYPVRFGDKFSGRAILIKDWKTVESLPIPSIKRQLVIATGQGTDMNALGLHKGDQIKVRIRLTPAEYGDFQSVKRAVLSMASELSIEVCGVELERQESVPLPKIPVRRLVRSHEAVLRAFAKHNKLAADSVEIGLSLLKAPK